MDASAIERVETGNSGEYRLTDADSGAISRLTWTERGGVRHAEHTLVPGELRGRGIAAQLVDALVEDAKAQGFRISPDCSYVEAAFRRHPEWADLRA